MTKHPKNKTAAKLREQVDPGTLDKLLNYLSRLSDSVGLRGAPNRCLQRRRRIVKHIQHWETKLLNARRSARPAPGDHSCSECPGPGDGSQEGYGRWPETDASS
ncbi:hypothetical protein B0T20DRAFT_833 [Sordaria brevicollis]|uniref:Uncharacterized protein n=1 Tax=Sordaria brevicollis TaxID=83679 RepID=A0AAE0PMU7_SORBR|nr:hypothetical protein B0T20DRAFT_833 [Sordaria brevicollis]